MRFKMYDVILEPNFIKLKVICEDREEPSWLVEPYLKANPKLKDHSIYQIALTDITDSDIYDVLIGPRFDKKGAQ